MIEHTCPACLIPSMHPCVTKLGPDTTDCYPTSVYPILHNGVFRGSGMKQEPCDLISVSISRRDDDSVWMIVGTVDFDFCYL